MSLRTQAAADFAAIAQNMAEFGWRATVTNPDGLQAAVTGLSVDVHAAIDPDTGQLISGRSVSLTLPIAAVVAAGLGEPAGPVDPSRLPWRVAFDDVNGNSYTFAIASTMPDRTIGAVVCRLEQYSHT